MSFRFINKTLRLNNLTQYNSYEYEKFQCLLFVLKRSYIYHITCMTVSLKCWVALQKRFNVMMKTCGIWSLMGHTGHLLVLALVNIFVKCLSFYCLKIERQHVNVTMKKNSVLRCLPILQSQFKNVFKNFLRNKGSIKVKANVGAP